MSPEFYAIIGVGVSVLGFLSGLTAFVFFMFSQLNRRMDRLEVRMDRLDDRMDRLEDKLDRQQEQMIALERQLLALEKRVSKLEWMLDAALYGKPVTFPAVPDAEPGKPEEE